MSLFTTLAVILGMAFSVGLFFVLPTLLSGAIMYFFPTVPLWARNVVEGATRVVIFLGYLILCSKMKDIRRVFSYHGAEHKTIFCYEKGLALTVENVHIQPKHHPRCGTSFLFVVIVVSILLSSVVFAFWQFTNPWLRTLVHLALLPWWWDLPGNSTAMWEDTTISSAAPFGGPAWPFSAGLPLSRTTP